jgi:WD40 repeat protein
MKKIVLKSLMVISYMCFLQASGEVPTLNRVPSLGLAPLLQGSPSYLTASCCDALRKRMIIGYADGSVKIFNEYNSCIKRYEAHKVRLISIAVGKDGKIITSGSDGSISLYNLERDEFAELIPADAVEEAAFHSGAATFLCEHPTNSGIIVTGHENGAVRIWDLVSGEMYLAEHVHFYAIKYLSVTADNKLISLSSDGKLVLSDLFNDEKGGDVLQWQLPVHIDAAYTDFNDSQKICILSNKKLYVYDFRDCSLAW